MGGVTVAETALACGIKLEVLEDLIEMFVTAESKYMARIESLDTIPELKRQLDIAKIALCHYADRDTWVRGHGGALCGYYRPAFGLPSHPGCDGFHVATSALERMKINA